MTDPHRELAFDTCAIRAGKESRPGDGGTGDVVTPIHLASTFEMDRAGDPTHGYKYSRFGNPTRDVLESRLATLEGAQHGLAFTSGMAAIASTCLSILRPGDHVVAFDSLFGGTKIMFEELFVSRWDVEVDYVDATNLDSVADALRPETALVWMESPTNPLLKVCDLDAVADLADDCNVPLVVDNTFATPYFQRPLDLGADATVYSTTKFVNGHSDSVGGAVVTNDDSLADRIRFTQQYGLGSMLAPFDCYMVLRGLKTLPARMRLHERNAQRIAEHLDAHEKVETVYYPGLESHPQHELASRQMSGFGGVVSFEIDGDGIEARAFVEELELFDVAVSLGGVESLIEHTASMSASYVPEEQRRAAGITDSLIRAPVGLENADDLIADLDRALSYL